MAQGIHGVGEKQMLSNVGVSGRVWSSVPWKKFVDRALIVVATIKENGAEITRNSGQLVGQMAVNCLGVDFEVST